MNVNRNHLKMRDSPILTVHKIHGKQKMECLPLKTSVSSDLLFVREDKFTQF